MTTKIRPLVAADLSRVVELDQATGGTPRRGFFEKRLQAHLKNAKAYLSIGAETDGQLTAFLLAHLQDGEFGTEGQVAVLDALSVDPQSQGKGVGHLMMSELKQTMSERGAAELQTQSDWGQPGLLEFFASEGFTLAPKCVLERAAENVNF